MRPDPAAFWDTRYAEPGYAYGEAPNDFLVEVVDRIPAGPVLCLAEGEGRNAVMLAARGHDVTAVDLSAVGLAKASARARRAGVALTTVVADLASWPMPEGTYAAVVAIWAHLPPPVRGEVHRRVARALVPGGLFVLEAYRPGQERRGTGGPPDPALLMTSDALQGELAGLEVVIAREITRAIHEGHYHDGDSDVVQLLARRPPL
ncbi:MAG: SAM-dependent methyltransferase [Deltaproteobacteria bacterium RBG_16_71_12]|nr:MAG: SAM-dependent methyltransferase [Deltaproteobacteria bacterium RBG_16_71_12]